MAAAGGKLSIAASGRGKAVGGDGELGCGGSSVKFINIVCTVQCQIQSTAYCQDF